jgi:hypothetical protein
LNAPYYRELRDNTRKPTTSAGKVSLVHFKNETSPKNRGGIVHTQYLRADTVATYPALSSFLRVFPKPYMYLHHHYVLIPYISLLKNLRNHTYCPFSVPERLIQYKFMLALSFLSLFEVVR